MKKVIIDLSKIKDKETFHNVFDDIFGFPEYYGKNMDAWIDCMTTLDNTPSQTKKLTLKENEMLVLQLENAKYLKKNNPKIYDDLIECSAFVNWRRIEKGLQPILILSFYK